MRSPLCEEGEESLRWGLSEIEKIQPGTMGRALKRKPERELQTSEGSYSGNIQNVITDDDLFA